MSDPELGVEHVRDALIPCGRRDFPVHAEQNFRVQKRKYILKESFEFIDVIVDVGSSA